MLANEKEQLFLEKCYEGRRVFRGELHDHSSSGGRSDGKRCLLYWTCALEVLGLDFAAIVDHRQMRHMFNPLFTDGTFIGGTEPGTVIDDSSASLPQLHYNMLFSDPSEMQALLSEFPEYQFTGGWDGRFRYPHFTRERFGELIDAVRAHGGFFVHPHPKQLMVSDDPLDYYFRDETGLEVFYKDITRRGTKENYKLWTDLLSLGKRVWACAGGDGHSIPSDKAITTLYAKEKKSQAYLDALRAGDFVCGGVGIRMCVGEALMGSMATFEKKPLIVSVGDFHKSISCTEHRYRLDILKNETVAESYDFSCTSPLCVSILPEKDARYYRAEVFDKTRNLCIAIGNPIFNQKFYQ